MSVLYLLYQLIEKYSENLELLRGVDWVVVPVVNPDGYVYTYTNVRHNDLLNLFNTILNHYLPSGSFLAEKSSTN